MECNRQAVKIAARGKVWIIHVPVWRAKTPKFKALSANLSGRLLRDSRKFFLQKTAEGFCINPAVLSRVRIFFIPGGVNCAVPGLGRPSFGRCAGCEPRSSVPNARPRDAGRAGLRSASSNGGRTPGKGRQVGGDQFAHRSIAAGLVPVLRRKCPRGQTAASV